MVLYRPVKGDRDVDRRLTQGFGENVPYYSTIGRTKGHMGLDYAGKNPGDIQPIYSVEEGSVTFAGRDKSGFGNLVIVTGVSGRSYYAHLSSIGVKKGQWVKANQQIGLSGNTGNSTGVHLHFGWKPADKSLRNRKDWGDPTSYISDRVRRDPLVDRLIKEGYRNGIEGDGVTERIALLVAKTKYQ